MDLKQTLTLDTALKNMTFDTILASKPQTFATFFSKGTEAF